MPNKALLEKYLKQIENHRKNTGHAVESIEFKDPIRFAEFLEITVFQVYAEYGDPPYEIEVTEYDPDEPKN